MATVALSTLRSTLQTFVRDTDAKKWEADDLDTFINLAVTKWTTDLPIASADEYTIVSGQHEYTLPENAVAVSWVYGYFESGSTQEWLSPMHIRPGAFSTNDEPAGFIIGFPTEAQFYLPREPIAGDTFTLYYGARHTSLSADGDLLDLRQRAWGELAVLYYAAYLAYMPHAANRARLEQWARKGDLNVGNPLAEQAMRYKAMYDDLMELHSAPQVWEFVSAEGV
jgi:hypothetical protein